MKNIINTANNSNTNIDNTKEETTMKKLFHITHINPILNETTEELHSSNMAFRYAISKGLDPEVEFIFVESYIDEEHNEMKKTFFELCQTGITLDNHLFGNLYLPLCATASGRKMAQSIWCRADNYLLYSRHFRHGLPINGKKMEPAKFFTRIALYLSTSTPIEEVYPNFKVDFAKLHVFKDVERNGHNASDAAAFIFEDTNNLPSEAASWRPIKVDAIPVNKRAFLKALGSDPEFVDPWGNTHKLSETQVAVSESGMKWLSLAKSEKELIDAISEDGISVAVRMNKHAAKHLTYQPLQTLMLSDENIEKLEAIGSNYLKSLSELNNYIKLLPKQMREAITIYPQLVKEPYVAKAGRTAYHKQCLTLRGGALPLAGKFFAICPDPIDLFGGKGLKAGQCSCRALPEGKVVMIRYPHTSEASWVVLNNIHQNNGITDPNVMVLNNYDTTLRRLGGADYDGDKIMAITNKEIEAIILETLVSMGNPTTMPNTPEGKAIKALFNKDTAANIKLSYFSKITNRSQIGSVSNKLSAAYANLYEALAKLAATDPSDEAAYADAVKAVDVAKELICYWQMKVEITVDIEKHGDTKLYEPKALKTMNKDLPNFIKFAKIAKQIDKPVKDVVDDSKYARHPDSPLEKYSEYIEQNTSAQYTETVTQQCAVMGTFSANVEGDFHWQNLMFSGDLPKLNTKVFKRNEPLRDDDGRYVKDENGNNVYGNGGQFDNLVFATSDELRLMARDRGIEYTTISDLRTKMIDRLMTLYAERYNCSIEQVYDLIVYYIYTMEDGKGLEAYKRAFWECLHEYVERALTERFGALALEFKDELADIDDDDDEAADTDDDLCL